jgi:hypothetical protein
MANCNEIESILSSCDGNNSGGIFEAYIIDQDRVTGTTVSAHTVTAVALSGSALYSTFQFKRNVGNAVTTPTIDLINGSTFYSSTISLVLHRREASKSAALQILGEGQRYLNIILKDANGKYWMYDDAQLNGGDEDSGTSRGDGSKYTITFLAEDDVRPYEVDSGIIAALLS